MANCNPTELQQDACADKLSGFSEHQLYVVIAQALCSNMVSCDPEALLAAACENDLAGYSHRQLLILIAQSLCAGGGGGGATCIACADHDPVDGVDIPPCDCSIMVAKTVNNTNLWGSNDGATWFPIIYGG